MRSTTILSLAAFAGAFAVTSLHASEWDKKTTITINAPVQIPSTTLQPGTYTLKLLDSASDRHIVTVWDKDGMHLITTLLAIPNYRLKPTGESKFTFWETSAGQPAALRAWFYPGDNFGQEFAYPKSTAQQLSTATHDEVPTLSAQDEAKFGANKNEGTQMATSNEKSTTVETAPIETASAAPVTTAVNEPTSAPEPTPAQVVSAATTAPTNAEPATALSSPDPVAADQAPSSSAPGAMPETASKWNETMSFGLLLSLTGLSTFLVKKRSR